VLGLAAAAVVGPVAGCAPDDDAVAFFCQGRPEEISVRQKVVDEFHRRRPDIRVRMIVSGPDPLTQVLTYCAGGKCPDVMMAWELTYAGLAERGVLLDLNTLLEREPGYATSLRADCPPILYDTFGFRGGQYGLPEQWSGFFLYYNTEMFAAAGLPAPPSHWESAWSFAEFLRTAQALTRRDAHGKTTQWAFVDATVPYTAAAVFGMNNGLDWFTPPVDPVRTNLGDPRFLAGVQFYTDLAVAHGVAPLPADMESAAPSELFAGGAAAMMLSGHWLYSEVVASGVPFDVAVLPVGPQGGRVAKTGNGATGVAIAAGSPRREQAWEFVRFATGPEGQAIIAESGLFVPALRSAVNSAGFRSAHPAIRNLDVFLGGLDNVRHLAVTPQWGPIGAALQRGFDRVLRGAAPATYLRGAAAEIDRLLTGAQG
jgi:multiple sugar transport system substrate-binding protein